MTPEEIAQQEALKKQTEGFDKSTAKIKQFTDFLEDLEDPIKRQARLTADANKSFLSLDRAIKSGRTRWVDATDQIQRLAEQIEEVTDTSKKAELQKQLDTAKEKASAAQRNKFLADSFGELAKGVFNAGVGITKSVVNSYQSGASAFQTFGDAATAGLDATNNTVQGIAKAGGAGALALGALGVVSGGTAVALGAIVGVAAEVYNSFNDLAKFGINVAVKELDATAKSFNTASKAGAVFTGGIMDFRNAGPEVGLTMVQFSKLIAENGDKFAQFGGTVTAGIKGFRELSKGMLPAREGLIKLGYSIEEISEGALKYAAMSSSVSTRQRTDYDNLAKESTRYLENLRLISAFTGEDAKKAEAAADEAAADAAVDARLRKEYAEGNKEVVAKFRQMIAAAAPGAERAALKESFGMYGAMTEKTAFIMSQSPTLYQTVNENLRNLTDKTMSLSQVTDKQLRLQKDRAPLIQQEALSIQSSIGIAGNFDSALTDSGKEIRNLTDYYARIQRGESPEKIKKDLDTLKDAGGATADYAKLIIKGQDLHIRMQKELDVVITQFQKFAKVTDAVIKGIRDALGNAGYKPGNVSSSSSGGAPPVSSGRGAGTQGAAKEQIANAVAAVKGVFSGASAAGKGRGYVAGSGKELTLASLLSNPILSGLNVTSTNDGEHVPGSKHYENKAADFSVRGLAADEIVKKVAAIKNIDPTKIKVWAEDKSRDTDWAKSIIAAGGDVHPVGISSAPHIHMELMKKGGITTGPSIAGEAGPEAVVPLPDGRSIPVQIDMSAMIDKLDQLLSVMKDQHSTSEQILYAQS
jgi:hypothetical protein